jgi:hypothetical protein
MWPGLTGLRTKLPWQMIVAILSVGVVSAAGSRNRPLYPLGWVLGRTLRSAPRASYTAPPPNSDLTSTRCDSFSQSRRALTQLPQMIRADTDPLDQYPAPLLLGGRPRVCSRPHAQARRRRADLRVSRRTAPLQLQLRPEILHKGLTQGISGVTHPATCVRIDIDTGPACWVSVGRAFGRHRGF